MATQYDHVKAVLEKSGRALAIHQINARILSRFGIQHSDTAISARIREIRKDLEAEGRTIFSHRASETKHHHVYYIGSITRCP